MLDRLARIRATTTRVGLADKDATGAFGIVGLDAHGTSAPVEPEDVTLDYDHTLFAVDDDGRGSFTVTSLTGSGAGRIKATVAGVSTVLAVSVGLTEQSVSDFEDAGSWTFSQARADGSLAATPDGHTGTGLRLTYDFTRSTATRAAYAAPPRPVAVPGRPTGVHALDQGGRKRRLAHPAPQGRHAAPTSCCGGRTSPGPAGGRSPSPCRPARRCH